jgi:hypothetical protein
MLQHKAAFKKEAAGKKKIPINIVYILRLVDTRVSLHTKGCVSSATRER